MDEGSNVFARPANRWSGLQGIDVGVATEMSARIQAQAEVTIEKIRRSDGCPWESALLAGRSKSYGVATRLVADRTRNRGHAGSPYLHCGSGQGRRIHGLAK